MQRVRFASKSLSVLLVPFAFALSIAGCGGGSSTAATSNGSTSANTPGNAAAGQGTPQFIARADAVCGRINAQIIAIKAKSSSAAEVKRVVPHTLSIERTGLAELERVKPPASLARDWRLMLGYRRTLADELAQLLELAKKNDGTSVTSLAASKKRAHASLAKTAKANGFDACAKIGAVG